MQYCMIRFDVNRQIDVVMSAELSCAVSCYAVLRCAVLRCAVPCCTEPIYHIL